MKKRIADIVVDILYENGIRDCFSVVGGSAMHLNNAFAIAENRIKTIYNHHEQACAMAAEGYYRISGCMAAVCVTSGPGGLNTLNGVQGAWVDSIPMIVIAGHPRYDTTVDACELDIRCRGVQENNIIEQVKSVTKYAIMIKDAADVKKEIQHAIYVALDGRRGPVWVSIPLDIQGMMVEEDELKAESFMSSLTRPSDTDIDELIEKLRNAKRPCILTGSGIRSGNAHNKYKKFREFIDIPVVGGALIADVNYNGEKHYYGMSGSVGRRCGNFILQSADLILVLGNSLSTTQTGFNVEGFAQKAEIIMVDAQADEAKKPGLSVDCVINTDLNLFFDEVISKAIKVEADLNWYAHCEMLNRELPGFEVLSINGEFGKEERVHPQLFWKQFLNKIEDDATIALGNSSCVVGVLQEGINTSEQRVIVNYHCGSMGDDIPEAIGAVVANNKPVYCVTGDGSIMMNLQELQTVKYHRYPIKIVIFSNGGYGNIINTCNNFFGGKKNGCDSESGIDFPDFSKISKAFNLNYYHVKNVAELEKGIEWIVAEKGPCILEIDEIISEQRAPLLKSVMDENGVFTTPSLHEMYPVLSKEKLDRYLLK